MTLDEIRELTPTELSSRKKELRQEIFHLRLQQQADRQAGRQAGRQADRPTDRQTDRQTDPQALCSFE